MNLGRKKRAFIGISVFIVILISISIYEQQTSPEEFQKAARESLIRHLSSWENSEGSNSSAQESFPSRNPRIIKHCRNTVQGKEMITDEFGAICKRENVLDSNGCCGLKDATQFFCDGCNERGCCGEFEICVSCCMKPQNKAALVAFIESAIVFVEHFFLSISDQFDLCLSKCRTSSLSVQHENTYRDPVNKFCYSELPPLLIFNE
ncbi:Oidioi.mRNA.OKI2018_I69.chr2.g4360.t1.cds [Oikopleura dioica]|uniref:SREBP regulating gene protein n=1 Tax=Oikopleura dioica TaxID=34765 RepID=A0ABN7T3I5_OIKDI|nr:Oidioi.mRNA.OKI2018_I69.chr2.g4360.t1.cds [Oikopleura dioica]